MLKIDFMINLSSESSWETAHVLLDLSVWAEELNVSTIDLDGSGITLLDVLLTTERGESPVLGDNDLLATREPKELLETDQMLKNLGYTHLY